VDYETGRGARLRDTGIVFRVLRIPFGGGIISPLPFHRLPWLVLSVPKPTHPSRLENFSFLNAGKPLPRPSTMNGLRLPAEGGFLNDPLQRHAGP
jgi:hypothetical protein